MNKLASIRSNTVYYKTEDKDPKYIPNFEIILIYEKAEYIRSNEGEIIRHRSLGEHRLTIGEDALKQTVEVLTEILNSTKNKTT